MNKEYWIEWGKAAIVRSVKTFAQVAGSMITAGQAFMEVNWLAIISISGTAAILSLITSVAGIPEVKKKEE